MKSLYIISLIAAIGFAPSAFAQESKAYEDPLGKPYLWDKLKENPNNTKLWTSYFGKDMFSLSAEEGQNLRKWKAYLTDRKTQMEESTEFIALNNKLGGAGSLNRDKEYLALLENIEKNFAPIEGYFERVFKELGKTYKPYASEYPKGGVSKELWIIEQENKLVELRKKEDLLAKKQ